MIARFLGICLIAVVASGQSSWGQVGAVRHVHDPTIIQCDDYFYLFGTGKGIPVRRSVDLVHWEMAGRVFDSDAPEWALKEIPRADNTWAPDISYHDGLYYLYYAVSTFGKQRSCIGLAVNETLDASSRKYRWVDRGKSLSPFQGSVISTPSMPLLWRTRWGSDGWRLVPSGVVSSWWLLTVRAEFLLGINQEYCRSPVGHGGCRSRRQISSGETATIIFSFRSTNAAKVLTARIELWLGGRRE